MLNENTTSDNQLMNIALLIANILMSGFAMIVNYIATNVEDLDKWMVFIMHAACTLFYIASFVSCILIVILNWDKVKKLFKRK